MLVHLGCSSSGRPELPGHDRLARALLGRPGLRDHAAVPHRARRGHVQPSHLPPLPRAGSLEDRLRRAVTSPDRRSLRREPLPLPALPPVPGDPETGARERARPLLRLPRRRRHRSRAARCAAGRGRLGGTDARRLGARLGGLDRRYGGDAVHVLPAARWTGHRLDPGGDDVRDGAARHVPAGQADGLVKGPPGPRGERAAAGFARRHGLEADQLEEREGHLWARIPGKPLREVAAVRASELVRDLAFSKSMRWNGDGVRFARPVRWRCLMLDDEGLDGNRSYGRRFAYGELEIPHADAYAEALRAGGVEPDAAERRRLIVAGLDALGDWRDPAGKLEEVVYMVEHPTVLEGRFDERLLSLPEIVIVTAMQSHQRYFPLGGARFAFVAGGGDAAVVRLGNERVLENRLEDAAFTFERDVKAGIDELAKEIATITFASGAGSFADKTQRLVRLVDALGGGEASREAARLAKADQAAELVREFPELEGSIGGEYARLA